MPTHSRPKSKSKRKTVPLPPPKTQMEHLNERFTDAASWVSYAMGTPVNIMIWVVLVVGWTSLYAIHPALQNVNFLPSWFTSQSYNFPLNLVTTVAELYIGFLVGAASNRTEKHNHDQVQQLAKMEQQNQRMEREHGKMLTEMRSMMKDLHSHTTCVGHTTIDTELPPTPPDFDPTGSMTVLPRALKEGAHERNPVLKPINPGD